MGQIDELQSRITAALDRISQGLEGMSVADGDAARSEELAQALEDEKLANAQLEERIKTLKSRMDAQTDEAARAQDAHAEALRRLDGDLQSLRAANDQLRDNNSKLREAVEAGVAEPHLINKAMMAELEGLRAARGADKAEADAILAELDRIIGAGDASQTEAEDA